jgi:mannose-6-phosphate isomerase-like protein (cupin superfamily)
MNLPKIAVIKLAFCGLLTTGLRAQTLGDRIDLYFSDWHTAASHASDGGLETREILTRGDAAHPSKKGAVLRYLDSYEYATLKPDATTTPIRLDQKQKILYVVSGRGTATAGQQQVALGPDVAVLVPSNLEFSIKNSGQEPLAMYVITEPTPSGFRPNSSLLVRDEGKLPITSTDNFWCHIVKTLFVTSDGLGTLESVLTVTFDPMTIARPHVVDHEDIEEVWSALSGTSIAFIGNQLRRQPPGVAYLHIPDNKTPHSNINYDQNSQVKFLYFARYHPHETQK